MRQFAGLFIAAGFGLLFVVLNAGRPVNPAVGLALRVLAVLLLAMVVALAARAGRRASATAGGSAGNLRTDRFSSGYWLVVAVEVMLLLGGAHVLRLLDAPRETGVAWVAVVVGLHFIAFLPVWKQRSILVPGVLLTGYGVAGLVMATTSVVAWVPLISGVLSGITLLACCLFVAAGLG